MDNSRERIIELAWTQFSKPAPRRFAKYILRGDVDKIDAMARYLWNVKLCASLTPVLNGAEIQLKNAIHRAMTKQHQVPTWYDNGLRLAESELVILKRTYRDVNAKGKRTADDMVAELNLKFWVNLLRSHYSKDVWSVISSRDFMPGKPALIQRNDAETLFNRMREIRNRAYHHEPIWNIPHLEQTHAEALAAIGWFSSRHMRTTRLIDTFPDVYQGGHRYWRVRLENEIFPPKA